MNSCEHIKNALMDDGLDAISRDDILATHLETCLECRRLLEAWEQIPGLLGQLPEHEPDESLTQTVLASARSAGQRSVTSARRRFIAPSLASAAVLLAAIGLSREMLLHEAPTLSLAPGHPAPAQIAPAAAPLDRFGDDLRHRVDNAESIDYRANEQAYFEAQRAAGKGKENNNVRLSGSRETRLHNESMPESEDESDLLGKNEVVADLPASPVTSSDTLHTGLKQDKKRGAESSEMAQMALETPAGELSKVQAPAKTALQDSDGEPGRAVSKADGYGQTSTAFDFFGHYRQTENLPFQSAKGYWANTYIPGDPEIRLLSARLAQWDRSWLDSDTSLEQGVEVVKQPFDAPADNALALSLMADTSAISEAPTRMRLQVGIRGIEHRRGQRPAMNVGLVLDLPADAPDEVRIATRALLDALLQSKQAGDRFSLVMTGSGLIVEADDFRFGSLQLAKQLILADGADRLSGEEPGLTIVEMTLYEAMQRAASMVQQSDDPGRPLGSSSVLLISANDLADIGQLVELAHQQAKDGVTLSVFPLGNRVQSSSVDQLVLAGLGNRRFLEAPGQARQVIEEELHASSRAVARAVRLSIKLAPGVRLINVVGSERLDTRHAQRVREIENSMDRRLSNNLGIQADRGQDEDGIQIVIPGIYSGDSVTVLLDVVTGRPGAIADVSLRYKDLVFLRNGSLQGHLELPSGPHSAAESMHGPAELAVLKNLLSYHFSAAVGQAAEALGRQQTAEAVAVLSSMRSTIEQARLALPAWTNDPDLIRDQQVLDRFIAALASPGAGAHQSMLADSLRYAAWAKTHRPLKEWK